MINQAVDPYHFVRRARQIKARIPIILSQWGLLPKFRRWRLSQDQDTGMVVLFGVLDAQHIGTHSTAPFSDYFDPRLLSDLATELHVQVLPSSIDGLRYAFVLDAGEPETPPESLEALAHYPIEQVLPPAEAAPFVDDHALLHQRLERFLKMTDALDDSDNATEHPLADALLMEEAEFDQRMAEYETNRNRSNAPGAAGV